MANVTMMRETHFGAQLRRLRERRNAPPPLGCLEAAGIPFTPAMWDALEAGTYMPRDPRALLDVVTCGLQLNQQGFELLLDQLGFDMLRASLQDDIAEMLLEI